MRHDKNDPTPNAATPPARAPEGTPGHKVPGLSFSPVAAPSPALPKGGGSLRGIGEKFQVAAAAGTGSMALPLPLSPTRPGGLSPSLSLSYDTGAGNSVFGLGWTLGVPAVTRKTEKRLPTYGDAEDSDVFLFAGAEDLVPARKQLAGGAWVEDTFETETHVVRRYRPRIEGSYLRIERLTAKSGPSAGEKHFRTVTADNVTHVFGDTPAARVADPSEPTRVFAWLLSRSEDDRGNVVVYTYVEEDMAGVPLGLPHETSRRQGLLPFTNRHLKRVRYGNTVPFDAESCKLEVVFDYGDHESAAPTPLPSQPWIARQDPFSSGRPGFEVRTCRLCRRVLMFHHFPELGETPSLVRSLDLTYAESASTSLLTGAMIKGYRKEADGSVTAESSPPLTMGYTVPSLDFTLKELSPETLEDVSAVELDAKSQWVDLDGSGLSGLLFERAGALHYKENLGSGKLLPARRLDTQPALAPLAGGMLQVRDVGGTGEPAVVSMDRPMAGYFPRIPAGDPESPEGGFAPFRPFASFPNINFQDPEIAPHVRFLDLNGDGLDDVLIVMGNHFVWYPSTGKDGYGPAHTFPRPMDDRAGPALAFASGPVARMAGFAIFTADMTGDGLSDLVCVRWSQVSYWPNLGNGKFGAEVVFTPPSHDTLFDPPHLFDPNRIRLADLDGTGPADVLYAAADGLRVYFNRSGNRLSERTTIAAFDTVSSGNVWSVVDLLGTGTGCILWRPTRAMGGSPPALYIDVLGGKKPHLLESADNHAGLVTKVHYAPSTKFYLADRKAGTPWATRLPFVVHVVDRVEHDDAIAKTRFVSTYSFHHGDYDGDEREFRGFGRVDRADTDFLAGAAGKGLFSDTPPPANNEFVLPPVLTKTWFHTGTFRRLRALEADYRTEYYNPAPGTADPHALPGALLPGSLSLGAQRHACRALKGAVLRTEVYSLDGSEKAGIPYTVSETSHAVVLVQPGVEEVGGKSAPPVFAAIGRESVTIAHERNPADPRISHKVVVEVDSLGHVTKAVTVAYPRMTVPADKPEQGKQWAALAENDFKHLADVQEGYRHGLPTAARVYELCGMPGPAGAGELYTFAEISAAALGAAEIPCEATPSGALEKRLIGSVKHRYLDSATIGFPAASQVPLPSGEADMKAIVFDSFSLAFTAGQVAAYEGRVTAATLAEGGYHVFTGPDGLQAWWVPSGRAVLDPAQFYLPVETIDPFGTATQIDYDEHALFATGITDALGNTVSAEIDYRVLAPWRMTDPNGNRSAVKLDALGRVVAAAVMGKVGGVDGDTLEDPTEKITYVTDAFDASPPGARKPNHVKVERREVHGAANVRWLVAYEYFDGSGRTAMAKVQAEPGLAPMRDANGNLLLDSSGDLVLAFAAQRWVGSGRQVVNNKGLAVKQYEPYFSATHEYEDETKLVEQGVTPILRYDALGRLVRTDLPNGTYKRVAFDAWSFSSWDENDTSGESGNLWTAARQPVAVPAPSDAESRAATLSLAHAGTFTTAHLDTLGRVFLTEPRLDAATIAPLRVELDIEGQALSVTDSLGRTSAEASHSVHRAPIRSFHVDSGERFGLADVAGAGLYAWDALGRRTRTGFDVLRRVTHVWVETPATGGGQPTEILQQRVVYGESAPSPEVNNLRGKVAIAFDPAGAAGADLFDFKGNPLATWRRLAASYAVDPDWTPVASADTPAEALAAAGSLLENAPSGGYVKHFSYDALNRPVSVTEPDQSIVKPTFNEAGFLEKVDVHIRGAAASTPFVANIDYDEKGRREKIAYGNGTETAHSYDPLTYRLTRLKTTRAGDGAVLQNLFYTYDAAGNIVAIEDTAHETVFFNASQVEPKAEYEYDALYQLVKATGREHAGGLGDNQRDHDDLPLWNLPHPNDAAALRRYEEAYEYDLVGNLTKMVHTALNSAPGSWTRRYAYGSGNNRLHSTSLPGDPANGPFSATYAHDANGNIASMPHLAAIAYTAGDQMRAADLGGGGTAYYVYDAGGERVRKVIQRIGTTREERIYLGGFEIYRKRQGANGDVVLERETLHVMDDSQRIAMVETKTVDADVPGTLEIVPRIRYQYSNHLDSAHLECDGDGLVISYEEYHPYGTPAYRSARSGVEVSERRYRYTGKERDEETGFQYHSARYYAPWLGRWTSADPAGMVDGVGLYGYVKANPTSLSDPEGRQSVPFPTEDPTSTEHAAQTSIQEEHEPPKFMVHIEGVGDVALSEYADYVDEGGDVKPPSEWPSRIEYTPENVDDFYARLERAQTVVRGAQEPAALPLYEPPNPAEVASNALVLAPFDFLLFFTSTFNEESWDVAGNKRQELRPFPYSSEHLGSGNAVESLLIVGITSGAGAIFKALSASTALDAVAGAQSSLAPPAKLSSGSSGAWSGLPATPTARELAATLVQSGDTAVLPRGLTLADLGSLASSEGVEFAVIRSGTQRLILRGYSTGAQVPENAKLIAHVHPGQNYMGLAPSADDLLALERLRMFRSAIVNETGSWRTFGRQGGSPYAHIQ